MFVSSPHKKSFLFIRGIFVFIMIKTSAKTLSKSEVEKIDSSYVRGVDKWRRMYAGIASNLERYEKDIIYLRIENTERKFPSDFVTALQIAKGWVEFNKELRNAKGFTVSFSSTKATGFVLNFDDLKGESRIREVVEELKSARKQKSEHVSIFSGFL